MELIRFIFQDIYHFIGTVILLEIIVRPFLPGKDNEDEESEVE